MKKKQLVQLLTQIMAQVLVVAITHWYALRCLMSISYFITNNIKHMRSFYGILKVCFVVVSFLLLN